MEHIVEYQNVAYNTKSGITTGYLTKCGRIVKSWKKRYFVLEVSYFLHQLSILSYTY